MVNQDYYLSLPHDMSGSVSKNRFRMELLWGISKMIDIYDSGDFTMVFDYACDIEIHYEDGFEFYQIKTHTGNHTYTWKKLSEVKGVGSILGKLYILDKGNCGIKTQFAVVSNSYLKTGQELQKKLECCFDSLSENESKELSEALKKELRVDNVDLSKAFFIHTDMNLADPKNEIMGKLIISFEKIKGCEPQNPNALYRLIYDTVVDRASYEYTSDEYEAIIAHKGITKNEFDRMLDIHADNARTGIKQTEAYINELRDIRKKRAYKKVLPSVIKIMCTSMVIRQIEKQMGAFLIEHANEVETLDIGVTLLQKNFNNAFPKEISEEEKFVLYLIVLCRFVEGVYEE